jgi:hypothetical protein
MVQLLKQYALTGSVAALLVFILVGTAFAVEPGAGDAAHFLRDGVGARARGMGGAFTVIADDVNAPYWNPAGLIQSPSLRVGGTYESRYGGLSEFQTVGAILASPVMGGGFLWVHSDMYSVYTLSGGVGWDAFALGVSGKLYAFAVPGQRASGLGIDVGGLYRGAAGGLEVVVGATTNDVGWSVIRWEGEGFASRDRVAWVNRLGVAVEGAMPGGRWQVGMELELALRRPPLPDEEDYFSAAVQTNLSLGGELSLHWFALRAGFADIGLGDIEGLSLRPCFGAGIQLEGIAIDVAWVPSQLGGTYLLSMEFGL